MTTIKAVAWGDPVAEALWAEQQTELAAIYGVPDLESDLGPSGLLASLVAFDDDGAPVGSGVLRDVGDGVGELKRMYVVPACRGRGTSRLVLRDLERRARAAGQERLILESGLRQPEAIGLYRSAGYTRIPNFGIYADEPESVCFGKDLVIRRVLVLTGTICAGKSRIAGAIYTLLRDRDVPHARIDVDELCQTWPTTPGDPAEDGLAFANLAGVAPNLMERGLSSVVLARVVEKAGDRERYQGVFPGAAITIVRVTASEATRRARVLQREPEGYWQDWGLARTVELEETLDRLAAEDFSVSNDGRPAPEVAAEVLERAGWV
jgi:GNAT superfamily N-acetyltransferase/predicted kinase